MVEHDGFLPLVERGFPEQPVPKRFFRRDYERSYDRDMIEELSRRIERRSWKEVAILDWRMVGCPPVISRSFLEPTAFVYYLPSLLVGAVRDIADVGFALETIIPDNKFHIPRGKWWSEFFGSVSPLQCKVLCEFLSLTRRAGWNEIGPANQAFLEHAESIWSASGK